VIRRSTIVGERHRFREDPEMLMTQEEREAELADRGPRRGRCPVCRDVLHEAIARGVRVVVCHAGQHRVIS